MKILFARHGESVDDIEDRYGGWADFYLTEYGKRQIAKTARKITSLDGNFEIVLSSPLKRASQAAEIISNQLDTDVVVFEYLKERNLNGVLTGLTRIEAKKKYPEQVEKHDRWEYVDGSERVEDFNRRVKSASDYLLKMRYNSLVAVTHGLFIKTFFREMMNTNTAKIGDGGFALIEFDNSNFKLIQMDGIELEN